MMNFLEALKTECEISARDCYEGYLGNDKRMVSVGAYAFQVAKRLSDDYHTITVEKCRYHLKKLERQGLVLSKPTAGGYTRWWPVGFSENYK